jgi:hypothetical protein
MTQVVSPHVGGTAAIVSCEGCQYAAGNNERLVELDIAIVLDEQQVNALIECRCTEMRNAMSFDSNEQ